MDKTNLALENTQSIVYLFYTYAFTNGNKGYGATIVPFAWMILTALKTNQEAISVDPFYIFPEHGWHWENFGEVWQSYNFIVLYKNTLLMILFRVICACLTATMAGYAFGRLKFPLKNFFFALVLVQMMIPAQIFIIPQYLMVSRLGLLNTISCLVFPGIFTALFAFKDLMWPMIVCTKAETTTHSAGLAKMQGQFSSNYPTMMAAAVLAVVPMIIIYVIFQKQFVEGIATSGGKL